MESRLPKPKVIVKKEIYEMDLNTKSSNSGAMKDKYKNVPKLKSFVDRKPANENKPLVKQPLVHSKTFVSTRSNNAMAIKRAATTITHGEPKRPCIKPVAKTLINRPNNNTVSKAPQNDADKAGKLKKWDLRGRLAHTSDKLTVVQQKNKDMMSKHKELQELVDTLRSSEIKCRTKAGELETANNALKNELQTLTTEVCTMRKHQEDLTNNLKESEESCRSLSQKLEKLRNESKEQEALLTKQTKQVITLQANLVSEEETSRSLNITVEQLQALTHQMDKERRLLHNAIQELKGNIRVFCRVRPRTLKEVKQAKTLSSINYVDDCTIEIAKIDNSDAISYSGKLRGNKQEFSFDKVFSPNASQEDIFEELALLVQSALEGYNVCVFAYGQTGSGKTYTMEGENSLLTEGMIPRTVRHIFKEMAQFKLLGWDYRIEASFLEIYNEHIIDLLDSQLKIHEIKMVDSKGQDLYVSNLHVQEIHSPEELHECLQTAQRNRAVAATQSNERSSRSHSVTRIKLIGTHASKQEMSIGNLNLVDLAGSERLKSEEATRTAETKNINKSLANLGNVILALLKKQEHVPYRNSKLTHLLMPSLGGNSKTLMLLNISPLDECYNETLNSLRFASNVNSCKTGSIKKSRMILPTTNV